MKDSEIRALSMDMWGHRCSWEGCTEIDTPQTPLSVHHALVNDSVCNKGQYPLLVRSLFNRRPLCYRHHELHRNYWILSEHQAQCLERYLEDLTKDES